MKDQLWFRKYKPVQLLTATNCKEVFLVSHTMLDEKRIMKRIQKNIPEYQQTRREAEILLRIKHPNIPVVYDIEEDDENLYIFEENVQGLYFADYKRSYGAFTEKQVILYGQCLCRLLLFLHEDREVLHLDISPCNVIMTSQDIKLIDFGSSEWMNGERRVYRYATPYFAAPELKLSGTVDERADIYAVGRLLLYMYDETAKQNKSLLKILKHCANELESSRFRYIRDVYDRLNEQERTGKRFFGRTLPGRTKD